MSGRLRFPIERQGEAAALSAPGVAGAADPGPALAGAPNPPGPPESPAAQGEDPQPCTARAARITTPRTSGTRRRGRLKGRARREGTGWVKKEAMGPFEPGA